MLNYVALTILTMRTESPNKSTKLDLTTRLKELKINQLAVDCGFKKRSSGKIKAIDLIHCFYSASNTGQFSLSSWAVQLSRSCKMKLTKQAVFYRVNSNFIVLLKSILEKAILKHCKYKNRTSNSRFTNVYLQDGTTLKLPDPLSTFYKGNYSLGKTKAVAKVQVIYNVKKECFTSLKLDSYTRNDQAASADILPILKKGDLVIRDMGYFVLRTFRKIIDKGADFITLYRNDVSIFDATTLEPICFGKALKNKKRIKLQILLGAKEHLPCTLVAIKVSDKIANARRRKAIKNRDRRRQYTADRLNLLGWDIFICSMNDMEPKEIQEIYSTRWHIEIIFKSWKSGLKLEANIPKQLKYVYLAEAVIYLQLINIVLMLNPILIQLRLLSKKICRQISLLKAIPIMMIALVENGMQISLEEMGKSLQILLYEKRNRKSMELKLEILT